MYKVFIDNKEVRFVELSLKKEKKRFESLLFPELGGSKAFFQKVNSLEKGKVLLVRCADPKADFKKLFKSYKKISAAGGIVERKKSILAIYRLDKWDLPKGKIEKNEDPQTAAYREIEEECGISGHILSDKICETYHTYEWGGKKVLKRNYWFRFTYDGPKVLIPQVEEDISEATWMKKSNLSTFENNTYASILSVLKSWKKKFG